MSIKKQMSDTLFIGIILAIVGGYLDAYTYVSRGAVFANAQTGNMVLMGIKFIEGDWMHAFYYVMPILAFFIGIIVSEMIKRHYQFHPLIHWRQIILVIELLALLLVSFIPQGNLNMLCNIIVSFVCSLQVESFRKFNGNPYASTMCTGNLRSATEHLYNYRQTKDKKTLYKSLQYYMIIFFFISGAGIGAAMTTCFTIYAALLPVILLAIVTSVMFLKQEG